jgi:hypothetical protein
MIGHDVPSMPSVNFEIDATLFETHYTSYLALKPAGNGSAIRFETFKTARQSVHQNKRRMKRDLSFRDTKRAGEAHKQPAFSITRREGPQADRRGSLFEPAHN